MLDSNKNVAYVEKKGVPFLKFPIFEKYPIIHGFSSRLGGVSTGDCAAMNLSFTRGDRLEDVKENHRIFADVVGYDVEQLVLTEQVHSTNILRVGKKDTGEVFCPDRSIKETDGLVTDEPGVVLMTFFADCVPLMFYDTVKHAVGNAHSGWRGTVQRMGQNMVEKMQQEFGSCPENMIAVVGPSICQKCYEVSEEVITEFQNAFDKRYWDDLFYKKPDGHYELDLWRANQIILEEAGVKKENICVSSLCTNCHPDLLFSHRFTKGRRGNLAAVIGLRE